MFREMADHEHIIKLTNVLKADTTATFIWS